MWDVGHGMRDPTDAKGKGSAGQVGGLPTQEYIFSVCIFSVYFLCEFAPPQFLECRNNTKERFIQKTHLGTSASLYPHSQGTPRSLGLHLLSEGTARCVGASPVLLGSMGFPPNVKHIV